MSQPGQEDEQTQRLEVKDEDLAEAKDKLGTSGAVKGKTFQVMQECEKMGKAAPSVFSGAKSGGETVFNTRSARPAKK
ncbi:musculoskeletal embryonic nuclear protein 1-like isoform X2 [Parambassis ranga]|uniref:Musculoskeletal embryonic nuclear protein 1 n=1 Tax=Parambassis ranga TaxID=210632 RepID=A0A6P7IDD0_9TELE|nr:musculoskeletal embryonic nuclear protein 1-like isoform X2 [Parambassis ranga]